MKEVATREDKEAEIQSILDNTKLEAAEKAGDLRASLALARNLQKLRQLITPDMMRDVMALMNSPLGFKTDRDPRLDPKCQPYSVDVIRDVFIEALIRDFPPIGNHYNVINGQFYPTKNGLRRKLRLFPGLTDLDRRIGLPVYKTDKDGNVIGAIVPCSATWRLDGHPGQIECEIPVRVNRGMGADAILGKAERKLDARILSKLTGTEWTEGEVDDLELRNGAEGDSSEPKGVAALKQKLAAKDDEASQ